MICERPTKKATKRVTTTANMMPRTTAAATETADTEATGVMATTTDVGGAVRYSVPIRTATTASTRKAMTEIDETIADMADTEIEAFSAFHCRIS